MKTLMSERQLRALARVIEQREEELRSRIAEEREHAVEGGFAEPANGTGDVVDQAYARSHFTSEYRKIDTLLAEIRELMAARGRLDSGVFGVCIECGEPIDRARLRAVPTAARCTTCQERYERAQYVVRH